MRTILISTLGVYSIENENGNINELWFCKGGYFIFKSTTNKEMNKMSYYFHNS